MATKEQLKDLSAKEYMAYRAKERASLFSQLYRRLKGKPMRYMNKNNPFAWRPFLVDIMDDKHPDKVVKKPRQIGFSECSVDEGIWFVVNQPYTSCIYTFPRDKQLKRFSFTRVDLAIEESEFLSSISPSRLRSVYNKPFGSSYMFFTSAWDPALGEGQPCDLLFLDEYDRMPDKIETAFTESLASSTYGWKRRFSTPTIPTRGVSKLFDISDQQLYFLRCEHCGLKQNLNIEENLLQVRKDGVKKHIRYVADGTFMLVCKKCKKEINRMQKGEWVPTYTERAIRGYKLSRLEAPWTSADELVRARLNMDSEQLFRNYVLGEEWSDSGTLLTDQDFDQCVNPDLRRSYARGDCIQVSVGIDWGNVNWAVVLGLTQTGKIRLLDLFFAEDTKRPLEAVKLLASKIKPYEPDLIIGDFGYGKDRNALMLEMFPQKAFACKYMDTGFLARWNPNSYMVTVNKTISVKQVISTFKQKDVIEICQPDENVNLLKEHLKNLTVMVEEDEEKGEIIETIENMGPDHFAMAFNYAYIGIERDRFMIREEGDIEFTFMDLEPGNEDGFQPSNVLPKNGTIRDIDELDDFWRDKITVV